MLALSASLFAFCGQCETPGPPTPANISSWRAALEAERTAALAKIGWAGGNLGNPALLWTQDSYIQTQMHPYDRFFYDPQRGYTVHRYLNDVTLRYGGIDSLLLWPTYTNIGIDDRNQFDYFRAMPGGLAGVANVTAELKRAGVRVLWPYNPWDTGTRREAIWRRHGDNSDARTLAALIKQTGGDGFNGDTMSFVPAQFWDAAEADKYPLAFEPEIGGSDAALNWTTMAWGYWMFANAVPVVDRFKFLTRGKFLTHACDRWSTNKTDNLQAAWFNGDGYESWENVWGTWNGIVPRDGEAIRRVGAMLRFFGGHARVLHSELWQPHTADVLPAHVYASRWPADAATREGVAQLWTLVNRAGGPVSGIPVLRVAPNSSTSRYFDCYAGVELTRGRPTAPLAPLAPFAGATASLVEDEAAKATKATKAAAAAAVEVELSFDIETEGYGCVVETVGAPTAAMAAHLAAMRRLTRTPLRAYSKTWTVLPQVMVPIGATPRPAAMPAGMVLVPACADYRFTTTGIMVEGDDAHGVGVQFPWEARPSKHHNHTISVGPFYIDVHPVTNARYGEYLDATGYAPADRTNWLRSWNGSASPPKALAQLPVTSISLGEARRFCAWAGARLPHAYEWQYAAQGTDGRLYPWGGDKAAPGALPPFHSGNTYPGPTPVGAHSPAGDSPFGVADMVGNVWQYTDEFYDEHTRAVVLRGGSNYRPAGSNWYFPNQVELNTHNKYFLFSDSYERAATIGMRCVVDA